MLDAAFVLKKRGGKCGIGVLAYSETLDVQSTSHMNLYINVREIDLLKKTASLIMKLS